MEETPIAIACVLPPMTDKEFAKVQAEFDEEEAAIRGTSTTLPVSEVVPKPKEKREKVVFTKKYK